MRSDARLVFRPLFILAAFLFAALATLLLAHILHGKAYGLPLTDDFNHDRGKWTAYGGVWQIAGGVMENVSDERGAKLLRGSPYWTDYVVDADLRLDGDSGDAGLMLRVQDPDEGVDAFHGFYTGLRLQDNSLIGGDADYGWVELPPQPLSAKLHPFEWYHLRAAVRGCHLDVQASTEDNVPLAAIHAEMPSCSDRGQIGLRSYASGGSWRNLRVKALGSQRGATHD